MKHQWQYNGVASWNTIVQWCEKHFGDDNYYDYPESPRWRARRETIYFQRDEDYVLFLLRWS